MSFFRLRYFEDAETGRKRTITKTETDKRKKKSKKNEKSKFRKTLGFRDVTKKIWGLQMGLHKL